MRWELSRGPWGADAVAVGEVAVKGAGFFNGFSEADTEAVFDKNDTDLIGVLDKADDEPRVSARPPQIVEAPVEDPLHQRIRRNGRAGARGSS